MELKYIFGIVIAWYVFSLILFLLLGKFFDTIQRAEFTNFIEFIGDQIDEVTGFDERDGFVQFVMGVMILPTFPLIAGGYLIFIVLRGFFLIFLKLPLRFIDRGLEKIANLIKG